MTLLRRLRLAPLTPPPLISPAIPHPRCSCILPRHPLLQGSFGRKWHSVSPAAWKVSGGTAMRTFSGKILDVALELDQRRSMSTAAAAAAAEKVAPDGAQKVAMKVVMPSPGFVFEPYAPRERVSFWQRWFTLAGWRRTKEDLISEMKSAYAINRLRKSGYKKRLLYQEAINLYKEINTSMASGYNQSLRKLVTESMYSTLKNELKRRKSKQISMHWELIEPVVSIRTLRARMIGIDKNDLDKCFVQITLELVSKQKYEVCDAKGKVLSGDKMKELLVKDVWVLEKSLFHKGADWRLCARLSL